MRLPPSTARAAESGAPTDPAADAQSHAEGTLLGGWSATRWQYTGPSGRSVDVVCDLGGSVSLSLSSTAFILAYTIAGQANPGVSGTFVVSDDELIMTRPGVSESEAVRFRLAERTLSLYSDSSGWDFDGNGADEPAEFVAVLVRL